MCVPTFKYSVELVTLSDCQNFVSAITGKAKKIVLTDGAGFCVNAQSLLGALAAVEWDHLYCMSTEDIYTNIKPWIRS